MSDCFVTPRAGPAEQAGFGRSECGIVLRVSDVRL